MSLTRDQILSVELPTETVKVKEWGGEVIVRTMTCEERFDFDLKEGDVEQDGKTFLAKLVVSTVVDDNGDRLFTKADVPALMKKSAAAVLRVGKVAMKLNALAEDDMKALEKNS